MEQREGYKKTEIGWIPEEWDVVELEHTTDKTDRYSIAGGPFGSDLKSEHYTETGVRVIQLQNMGDGNFLNSYKIYTTEDKADELKKCNIFPGEIIIAKMADPLARACIIPAREKRYLMCSDGIRLKVDKSKYDNRFLLFSINSKYFRTIAEANGTGTTRLRIGLKTLKGLPILSPPLPEQNKIADILTTVDEKISSIDSQIQQTEQLKKGLMEKLLTEGIGHTEFKETEIGRIPIGWDVEQLGFYLDLITYGFTNPMPTTKSGPFMITALNINNGRILYENCRKTTQDAYDNLLTDKSRPQIYDVLLTKDGTLGRVAVVENINCCINQSVALLRPNDKINPYFLKYLLQAPKYQKIMILNSGGTSIKHIYITVVKKMSLGVPPLPEQKQIATILSTVDDKLDILNQKKFRYQTLKKGLFQQLLTGQMRVKV